MGQKHAWEKIVLNFYFSRTVNSNKYAVLTTLSSTLLRTKKKTVKKSEIWGKFFTTGCVFYLVGDWDDLQIDPHVSLHDLFIIIYYMYLIGITLQLFKKIFRLIHESICL